MKQEKEYYSQLSEQIQSEKPFLNYTDLSYEMILKEILNGNITNDDVLKQEQVSTLFDLSRTPVRDALLKLESEGYLTRSDKGSFKLASSSLVDYLDFSEMRIVVEPKTAALAARRASEEQIQDIKQNIDKLKVLVKDEENNILRIMDVDYEFHYLIAKASGNMYLLELLENHKVKMTFNFRFVVKEGSIQKLYRTHLRIYEAIANGDDELAEKLMYKHLQFYVDNLRASFK